MRKLERLVHDIEDETLREEILREVQRLGMKKCPPESGGPENWKGPHQELMCQLEGLVESYQDRMEVDKKTAYEFIVRLHSLAEKIYSNLREHDPDEIPFL